jgi:hypothetical protein
MSRVLKTKVRPRSSASKSALLRSFSRHSAVMPSCSNCERFGLSSCKVSPSDSSRCEECILRNRPGCDVLGPSPTQIELAGRSFCQADEELEAVEEAAAELQAKVLRLRRQRKLLAERWYRVFRRGLQSLEELEKVEAEERRQSELLSADSSLAAALGPSSAEPPASAGVEFDPSFSDWLATEFPLDPSLLSAPLADPGVVGGTVEQVPDNSPRAS